MKFKDAIKERAARITFLKRAYNVLFGPKRYSYLLSAIRENKCRKIMEIGVWDGEHATAMINEAKKMFGNRVEYYGFDLFEDLTKEKYQKEVAKYPPEMKFVMKKLQKTGCKITLFKGDTKKTLPKAAKFLPKMDLIFIDGGHSIETISNDWRYAEKLMHEKTIILFDDYWNLEGSGCKKVVDAIDRDKYKVEILPIKDRFRKEWGMLEIQFALVTPADSR